MTPAASVVVGGFQTVPITLAFDGNFYELSDFLFRLRTLVGVRAGELRAAGRLFAVESISFAESSKGFPELGATLSIVAYVYGTDTTASAGAPPGAPPEADRAPPRQIRMQRHRHLTGRRTDWSGGESLMAKRVDPLAAKKAKQKKLAIVLCVLLAGGRGLPGPEDAEDDEGAGRRLPRRLRRPRPPTTPGTAPGPRRGPAVPTQEAVLADSDVAPDAESGQLISIDSFSTKDPFKQQLTVKRAPSDNPAPANDSAPGRSTPATDTPSSSGAPPGTFDPLGSNPQDQDPNAPTR